VDADPQPCLISPIVSWQPVDSNRPLGEHLGRLSVKVDSRKLLAVPQAFMNGIQSEDSHSRKRHNQKIQAPKYDAHIESDEG
jgi:hypothetical protein